MQRAQRGGGGVVPLFIDQLIQESGVEPEANATLNPDKNYERQWAHTLLGKVKSKLREEFTKADRLEVFDELQVYLSGAKGEAPYQVFGQQLGLSVAAVKKNVERMRRQFGQILRDEIGETVLQPSEIEDGLRFLRGALKN